MRVENRAGLPPARIESLEREVGFHQNLGDVLAWGRGSEGGAALPEVLADVVVQDEFTHDLVVPRRDGLVLVYAAT